jgi:hypothetical protein
LTTHGTEVGVGVLDVVDVVVAAADDEELLVVLVVVLETELVVEHFDCTGVVTAV